MTLKKTLQNFLEKIKERFYSKNEVDKKISQVETNYQKKLTNGEGISISEDGVISINYPNGDEVAY